MATDRRIARAAGLIAALTLLSRLLGFVRESLAGRLFTRLETDAYIAAFAIPDFMYYLLVGGALSAAFIPVFTEYLARGEEKEGWRAASTLMNTITALLIVLTALGMIFAPFVARLEAPGYKQVEEAITTLTSPKFDQVAAFGFGTSQKIITRMIHQREVRVNQQPITDPEQLLQKGDIITNDSLGQIEVVETKEIRVRRTNVRLEVEETQTILASSRFDQVSAFGFGKSIKIITRMIRQREVQVNQQPITDPAQLLQEGDIITSHSLGQIEVVEVKQAKEIGVRRTNVRLNRVADLTRIMFSSVAMLAIVGLLSGVLYSYQKFFTPALGPVLYNIGIIAGAVLLGSSYGIKGMAAGVVCGALASLVLQTWSVTRRHPAYSPFMFDFHHPGFIRMLQLLLPALFGLSATQLNILFTTMMASGLPEGSISALRWANRLIQLPLGIFAAAIGTAFFPAMARAVAEKKMDSYRETFSLGLRAILFITIPSAVGLFVLRYPIIRLLFEGQSFTAKDTNLTAFALAFYSLGLFAHAAILILPRAFYSLQDTKTPVLVTAATVAISLLLNLLFLRFTDLRHGGLALSFSTMGVLNMTALLFLLRRKVGRIGGRAILRTFILSALASTAMGLVLLLVDRFVLWLPVLAGRRPLLIAGVEVLAGMGAGIALYGALAYALRMEEARLVLEMVRRRLRRVRTSPEGAS